MRAQLSQGGGASASRRCESESEPCQHQGARQPRVAAALVVPVAAAGTPVVHLARESHAQQLNAGEVAAERPRARRRKRGSRAERRARQCDPPAAAGIQQPECQRRTRGRGSRGGRRGRRKSCMPQSRESESVGICMSAQHEASCAMTVCQPMVSSQASAKVALDASARGALGGASARGALEDRYEDRHLVVFNTSWLI